MPEEITVTVDLDVAEAYRSASYQDRRKLDLLVNLSLREATTGNRPLQDIMRKISESARARGLTPEILQSILDEA